MAEVLVRKSHPLKHQVNGHDKFSAFDVTGCFTVTQLQNHAGCPQQRMGKETAVCIHSEILVHHKEGWSDVADRKVDEAGD